MTRLCAALGLWSFALCLGQSESNGRSSEIVHLLTHLEPFEKWLNRGEIMLPFETYHSQGIAKIGSVFYLTAIEGSTAGHLIEFTLEPDPGARKPDDIAALRARPIKEIRLTDPANPRRIHPGGIDYDPRLHRIWCPLAEKNANTSTSVLAIRPRDLSYAIAGTINDHLGTTMADIASGRLRMIDYHTGMYSFPLRRDGSFPSELHAPEKFILPGEPIEYQDCKSVAPRYAVCAGHPPHRVDVIHFNADTDGKVSTPYGIETKYALGSTKLGREAMTFEVLTDGFARQFVRFYFKPDDGSNTSLKIYDAYPPDNSVSITGRLPLTGAGIPFVEMRTLQSNRIVLRARGSQCAKESCDYVFQKVPRGKYILTIMTPNEPAQKGASGEIDVGVDDVRFDFSPNASSGRR